MSELHQDTFAQPKEPASYWVGMTNKAASVSLLQIGSGLFFKSCRQGVVNFRSYRFVERRRRRTIIAPSAGKAKCLAIVSIQAP